MNHLRNYKISPSRGCLCCLATSDSKNAIISVMFDKLPYFGHISSKGPTLDFGFVCHFTINRNLLVHNNDF